MDRRTFFGLASAAAAAPFLPAIPETPAPIEFLPIPQIQYGAGLLALIDAIQKDIDGIMRLEMDKLAAVHVRYVHLPYPLNYTIPEESVEDLE